ncbi:MAG TPA: hypothetical protein DCG34_06835 [Clostridiales bacterium]|nr:hypothetical protein [Clostridiales bacterium]
MISLLCPLLDQTSSIFSLSKTSIKGGNEIWGQNIKPSTQYRVKYANPGISPKRNHPPLPSNHPYVQMLLHGLQGSGNAVNTGGVAHISQTVYFLRRGIETAGKLGRPDSLGDHLIE